jgi:hypothetical protein
LTEIKPTYFFTRTARAILHWEWMVGFFNDATASDPPSALTAFGSQHGCVDFQKHREGPTWTMSTPETLIFIAPVAFVEVPAKRQD